MKYKPVPAFSFDFLTPFYDTITELTGFGESFKKRILNLVKFQNGESLLDVGCGSGSLLIPAKRQNPNSIVVGVDPDPIILEIAKKKVLKSKLDIKLVKAFGESLPIKGSSFDVVVNVLVFHHLPTEIKKKIIQEVYRVLKPKGRFLLADFGKPKNKLWRIIFALGSIFEEAEYIKDNFDDKLPIFLADSGFQVKELNGRYYGVQFLLATKN